MKRTLKILLLAVLASLLAVQAVCAEGELVFERGKQVVLFEQDGVKLTLNGEVQDDGVMSVQLSGVLENKSGHSISVFYGGTCNGWSLRRFVLGNANDVASNSKAKTNLSLPYEDLEVKRYADLEEANFTFFISDSKTGEALATIEDVRVVFSQSGKAAMTYFEECPVLPEPTFCGAMYQSRKSGMIKVNGIDSSSAKYTYTSSQELRPAFDEYIQALQKMGFTVSGSGTSYTLSKGGEKLAKVSCDKDIHVEVLPGHANMTASGTTPQTTAPSGYTKKKLGDTLKTDTMQLCLTDSGVTDRVNSYEGAQPSLYFMLEPQNGNRFLYLKGTFKNAGSREVDIRHIYAQVVVDGKYTYEGDVHGLQPDGRDFQNYVSAQASVGCYVVFEIPSQVVNSYKSATVTLGFTDSFNTKITSAVTGYNFDYCDDVFEITLGKTETASARPSAKGNDAQSTTESGSDARGVITFQEIPWDSNPKEARKILFEKGYVSSRHVSSFSDSSTCMLSDGASSFYELAQYYEKVLYGDTSFYDDNKKKIAGYDVDTIALCYTYGIKNGKLDKKTQKLISVNVELNAPDTDAAMKDLLAKLTKVYGKPDAEGYSSYVWYGADDSMLLLYDFANPTLLYSKNNNKAYVQQMYAELGYVADEDDVDGL